MLAAAEVCRKRMEAHPTDFFVREAPGEIRAAAKTLADFVGADDLVFVDNATTGVAAVLHSLQFGRGDQLLTTNHVYGAVRNSLRHTAARYGAEVVEVPLGFPPPSPAAVVARVVEAITPRTRLVVVDHISSATALVLPVEEIVAACRAQGVPVLVDGAHAPGQLELDLTTLGADYYTGNLHKWLFAPKSCAFLWARDEHRGSLHPPVISWGYQQGWAAEFDWLGTRDLCPWLATPTAIAFSEQIGGRGMRAAIHQLCAAALDLLGEAWGATERAPSTMTAAMGIVPIPGCTATTVEEGARLQNHLSDAHNISAPVMIFEGRAYIRISAAPYNELDDYQRLAEALAR